MSCSTTHCFKMQLTTQYNLNCFIYADVFSHLSLISKKIIMSLYIFAPGPLRRLIQSHADLTLCHGFDCTVRVVWGCVELGVPVCRCWWGGRWRTGWGFQSATGTLSVDQVMLRLSQHSCWSLNSLRVDGYKCALQALTHAHINSFTFLRSAHLLCNIALFSVW